jgi:redox-sensitive bicupin YhaK (pirin superfamily)
VAEIIARDRIVSSEVQVSDTVVSSVFPLGFPWQTSDPFLFCVHHLDLYPAGNEAMGPAASLAGREIGMDFEGKDGWRMYHGDVVPGFPRHPHRGFETVTLARRGFIDHSDSLGATARFGQGDVQWMTAGRGIVHAEMFPLREREAENTAELFQIWLNLPRADKMVDPYFTMLWGHTIPEHAFQDGSGRATRVVTVAGALDGKAMPPPPPDSWAARADSGIAIWTIVMAPGAKWTLPVAGPGVRRTLYFFRGGRIRVGDHEQTAHAGLAVRADVPVTLENGPDEGELLLLEGRPIGEPVAQHGPFVMNVPTEIQQAFTDYRRTGFGGWPWPSDGPVHPREQGRFAVHADGRREEPR